MSIPLATIAARIMTLPATSFPRTLGKLDRLFHDPEIPTPVIASVIASDPVLTALVLGRAGISSPGEPTSVSNALVVLGTATVHGLIQSVRPLPLGFHAVIASQWSLANATAAMCRLLGAQSPILRELHLHEDTLHAIGLIHDLGSVVGHLLFSSEMHRAGQTLLAGDERPFSEILLDFLGATPALLGSLWAHHLNLPPLLVRSIHHQDDPFNAGDDAHGAMLVQVARNLVKGCGFATDHDPFVENIPTETLEALGLSLGDLQTATERFFAEEEELALYEGALLFRG